MNALIALNQDIINFLAFQAAHHGMTIALRLRVNDEYWNEDRFTGYSGLGISLTKYKPYGKWETLTVGCLDAKMALHRAMRFINE